MRGGAGVGRRLLGRPLALAEHPELVGAHPRSQVRLCTGHAGRREGPADLGGGIGATRTRCSSSSTSTCIAASRRRCRRSVTRCQSARPRVHREGEDIFVITWGAIVYTATEAARAKLEGEGISMEIVDLRSVMPWDQARRCSRATSTRRRRRYARAARGHPRRQLGGRDGGDDRRGGRRGHRRARAPDHRGGPVPLSPVLEKAYIPQVEESVNGVRGAGPGLCSGHRRGW